MSYGLFTELLEKVKSAPNQEEAIAIILEATNPDALSIWSSSNLRVDTAKFLDSSRISDYFIESEHDEKFNIKFEFQPVPDNVSFSARSVIVHINGPRESLKYVYDFFGPEAAIVRAVFGQDAYIIFKSILAQHLWEMQESLSHKIVFCGSSDNYRVHFVGEEIAPQRQYPNVGFSSCRQFHIADRSFFIRDYNFPVHESRLFKFFPNYNPAFRYFGAEIEMEFPAGAHEADKMKMIEQISDATEEYGVLKEDGSLSETHGFEFSSYPMTMAMWRKHLKGKLGDAFYLMSDLRMRSHMTDTCGMHVHVSRPNSKEAMLGRLNSMFYKPRASFYDMVFKISQRRASQLRRWANLGLVGESFNSPISMALDRAITGRRRFKNDFVPSKYFALNETQNTVEFRIFKGNLNPRRLLKNVEFCDACFAWAESNVNNPSPSSTEFSDFVSKNESKWPELSAFLVNQNILGKENFKIVPSNRQNS